MYKNSTNAMEIPSDFDVLSIGLHFQLLLPFNLVQQLNEVILSNEDELDSEALEHEKAGKIGGTSLRNILFRLKRKQQREELEAWDEIDELKGLPHADRIAILRKRFADKLSTLNQSNKALLAKTMGELDTSELAAHRSLDDFVSEAITKASVKNDVYGPPKPPLLVCQSGSELKPSSNAAQVIATLESMMSDHPYYNQPRPNEIRVFTAENLKQACTRMARDRERFFGFWLLVQKMARNNGYRSLIQISQIMENNISALRNQFLNFSEVIDRIMNQVMLWPYLNHSERRLTPILLVGPPGIGKSYFCEELAKALQVEYKRLDMGMITAGMTLTGSTSQWGNSQPGILMETIANSNSANSMWFLDEINNARESSNQPVMPVLLNLLEPNTSKCVRDEYCGVEFDLSRNIFIAATNDTYNMSPALLSRFERFVIPSPNTKQRRVVAKHLFEQRFANFMIEDAALDLLARLVLGLRELRRAVQQCGEMLVVELRRKGQTDVNALNDFQLTVREMHVREVISKNRYKLNTLFECQLDA
jgi:ATP-dependent Lon protease